MKAQYKLFGWRDAKSNDATKKTEPRRLNVENLNVE